MKKISTVLLITIICISCTDNELKEDINSIKEDIGSIKDDINSSINYSAGKVTYGIHNENDPVFNLDTLRAYSFKYEVFGNAKIRIEATVANGRKELLDFQNLFSSGVWHDTGNVSTTWTGGDILIETPNDSLDYVLFYYKRRVE